MCVRIKWFAYLIFLFFLNDNDSTTTARVFMVHYYTIAVSLVHEEHWCNIIVHGITNKLYTMPNVSRNNRIGVHFFFFVYSFVAKSCVNKMPTLDMYVGRLASEWIFEIVTNKRPNKTKRGQTGGVGSDRQLCCNIYFLYLHIIDNIRCADVSRPYSKGVRPVGKTKNLKNTEPLHTSLSAFKDSSP